MRSAQVKSWGILIIVFGAFALIISQARWWEAMLRFLFPQQTQVLYPGISLLALVGQHVKLVLISSGLTILVGVPLGTWVTRRSGRDFLPIVSNLTSLGQTFPPVAVLVLAVPVLGFGLLPTIVALFLYGLLPVVRNATAGLTAVPQHILDTAYGMGMNRVQALLRVEMPLAAPVIIAGIRVSVVINIGTAMIGALIGAGGLGVPIIAGLVEFNTAFVIEGALPAAILAVLADQLLTNIERSFRTPA